MIESIFPILDLYINGGPLYWMNETSGRLGCAVVNFFHDRMSHDDLRIIIEYVRHWVMAPCWYECEELHRLRSEIRIIHTERALRVFLHDLEELGIDPF